MVPGSPFPVTGLAGAPDGWPGPDPEPGTGNEGPQE